MTANAIQGFVATLAPDTRRAMLEVLRRIQAAEEVTQVVVPGITQGLADHETAPNPHPQYALDTDLNAAVAQFVADLAAHVAAANPHPQYLTQTEADALYDELGASAAVLATALAALEAHEDDLVAAHDASAISFDNGDLSPVTQAWLTADNVEDALEEIATEVDGRIENGDVQAIIDAINNWNTGDPQIGNSDVFEAEVIVSAAIAAGAIVASKIAANAVTTNALTAQAVTTAKLATDAIKSTNYSYTSGDYSTAGSFLDLANGNFRTPGLFANGSTGALKVKGDVTASALDLAPGGTSVGGMGVAPSGTILAGKPALVFKHGAGPTPTTLAWTTDPTNPAAFLATPPIHFTSGGGNFSAQIGMDVVDESWASAGMAALGFGSRQAAFDARITPTSTTSSMQSLALGGNGSGAQVIANAVSASSKVTLKAGSSLLEFQEGAIGNGLYINNPGLTQLYGSLDEKLRICAGSGGSGYISFWNNAVSARHGYLLVGTAVDLAGEGSRPVRLISGATAPLTVTANRVTIGQGNEIRLKAETDGNHTISWDGSLNPGILMDGPLIQGWANVGFRMASNGVMFMLHNDGWGRSNNGWTTWSSRRIKHDITPLDPEECLSEVVRWEPVSYLRNDSPDGPRYDGFIAEDFAEVTPSLVPSGDDVMPSIAYGTATVRLAGAVQALSAKVAEQAETIAELTDRLAALEARLA